MKALCRRQGTVLGTTSPQACGTIPTVRRLELIDATHDLHTCRRGPFTRSPFWSRFAIEVGTSSYLTIGPRFEVRHLFRPPHKSVGDRITNKTNTGFND